MGWATSARTTAPATIHEACSADSDGVDSAASAVIPVGTLRSILQQAHLEVEEWEADQRQRDRCGRCHASVPTGLSHSSLLNYGAGRERISSASRFMDRPRRALSEKERETVRDLLNSPRFVDCAPAAIQATLLDEGHYLCSARTMYRILEQDGASHERGNQLSHPALSETGVTRHCAQSIMEQGSY